MLDLIENSEKKYICVVAEAMTDVPVNETIEVMLVLLGANPNVTAQITAILLKVSDRTVNP